MNLAHIEAVVNLLEVQDVNPDAIRCMRSAIRQTREVSALKSYPLDPPQSFIAYVEANYSGDVTFIDPEWHAKRLWNAAMWSHGSSPQQMEDEIDWRAVGRIMDASLRIRGSSTVGTTNWAAAIWRAAQNTTKDAA
jgi:hypothetical protein